METLQGVNHVSVFCRLSLALLFGGIIGLERGFKKRAAGFRTYMLVCVGSALVMLTNQYIYQYFGTSDPARLGAQVVSGIGFLGAGTIIVTRGRQVIGLTTAAGLWASACMGIAIGIGFYSGAIVGGMLIFFIMTGLGYIDQKVMHNARAIDIYLELKEGHRPADFLSYAIENQITIINIEFLKPKYDGGSRLTAAIISMRLPRRCSHISFLEQCRLQECVSYIEEN
jgi:putative Mg2+ transporter-C (MgtC) family protein